MSTLVKHQILRERQEYKSQSTGRNLITDFKTESINGGVNLDSRTDLEKLIVELQGLLEERQKLDTIDKKTTTNKSKAARAIWMDRLAEIDSRFRLENFVDKVIAADSEHRNSDLFNRIFDLLEVVRNDNSGEAPVADSTNNDMSLNVGGAGGKG